MKLPVGSKIKFRREKLRYTVQASDERFAICTKPFNPQRTVLYSIIDFEEQVRGPEDLIFGAGAETREQCEEMLERLNGYESPTDRKNSREAYIKAGLDPNDTPGAIRTKVSHRHRCDLDIETIYPPEKEKIYENDDQSRVG